MSELTDPLRSKRYSTVKTRFFVANIFVTLVSIAVFQIFLSRPVSAAASSLFPNFYAACLLYSLVFLIFTYFAAFPLHIIDSFFIERGFGLSDRSIKSWVLDEVKSGVLSFVLWIGCIQVFYLVLRNFPALWWLIIALLWILFSVVMARFLPKLIIPIFFKYMPIEDEGLKSGIFALAERSGVKLMDVCKIDLSKKTKKANAALVGLGRTRKVILADTLVENFTQAEVETVVAHEFGHCKYRHIWQLLAFSGLVTTVGLYILSLIAVKIAVIAGASGITDLSLLPVLSFLATISGIILMPAQNFFSRVLEKQADRFALSLIPEPSSFISVMQKLAKTNLADPDPSLIKKIFLYNHPPVKERIHMAEVWKKA